MCSCPRWVSHWGNIISLLFTQCGTINKQLDSHLFQGHFPNGQKMFKCLSKQIVILLGNAAESPSGSSSSHKWVDVSSMSGFSHGNERAGERSSKRRGVIIGLSDHLCSRDLLNRVTCSAGTLQDHVALIPYSSHEKHIRTQRRQTSQVLTAAINMERREVVRILFDGRWRANAGEVQKRRKEMKTINAYMKYCAGRKCSPGW